MNEEVEDKDEFKCGACGGEIEEIDSSITQSRVYDIYECIECGHKGVVRSGLYGDIKDYDGLEKVNEDG